MAIAATAIEAAAQWAIVRRGTTDVNTHREESNDMSTVLEPAEPGGSPGNGDVEPSDVGPAAGQRRLVVASGALLAALVVFATAYGLFSVASSEEVETTETGDAETAADGSPLRDQPADEPPGSSTAGSSAAASSTAGSTAELADTLLAFGDSWEAGDWDRLGALASADAVTVAQEWFADGGDVIVGPDNLDAILDGCSAGEGGASCELLYSRGDGGSALIFTVTVAEAEVGMTVTSLAFAGDAG